MPTFAELFNTILTGDRDESRTAARQVRKQVYSSGDGNKYKSITSIIDNAPQEYEKIMEGFRQENFVVAISVMYFLHDKERHPDFLFPWLFHLLQHENGNIRLAAVRMIENELGPLTVHIRFPDKKSSYFGSFTPELADMILFGLFGNLNSLAADLWNPSYKKYKYISSLPNGPYKSVQMVLSVLEEDCGKEYLSRLDDSLRKMQIMESRKHIIKTVKEGGILNQTALTLLQSQLKKMREELENDMLPMMTSFYPRFDFKKVVSQVYEGNLSIPELTKLIDSSLNLDKQSTEQRSAFLDFVSTIWNIYPHRELEDYSPYEIAAMYELDQNKKH